MAIAENARHAPRQDGHRWARRAPTASSAVGAEDISRRWAGVADDAVYHVAFDELLLPACRFAKRGGGEAVDLPQARAGRLVQSASASAAKISRSAADATEPHADVLGGVVEGHGPDREPAIDAGVEGAVLSQLEAILELGEAHEDQGQQRATVPFVVQQDVQVVERVLVKQVRLVEQEDGMDALAAEVLDMEC